MSPATFPDNSPVLGKIFCVFILTHEDAATQNLFEIVDRYHQHCPVALRPSTGAANAKELNFNELDSGYKVGTAGTKGVGRSSTIQLFHGSEVAFWPNADSHAAGVLQAAGWLKQVIDADKPARVFIDVGGVGAGVYDRMAEMGYGGKVRPINFGSAPFEPPKREDAGGPANRRAEMWMKSKTWLQDPAGVNIPDSDSLQADACGPSYTYNSNSELLLERKDQMKKRGVPSPDEWDAVALTFAEPVITQRKPLDYSHLPRIV
jgi:hypothetical protein